MTGRILVVDDDVALAEMIGIVLRGEGFHVDFCVEGVSAAAVFARVNPDLVLLDIMLPGKNGIEVCKEIRRVSGTPIIMLTAKSEVSDIVAGLEAGADDYVPKPFKPQELVARIRARLRREERIKAKAPVAVRDVRIDPVGHSVTKDGRGVSLTPLEFDLLYALASSPEQVFSRQRLLEDVWGYHAEADARLVNVHVQRLRAKIEDDPENPMIVLTVRGVGYRAGSGQ